MITDDESADSVRDLVRSAGFMLAGGIGRLNSLAADLADCLAIPFSGDGNRSDPRLHPGRFVFACSAAGIQKVLAFGLFTHDFFGLLVFTQAKESRLA